MQLQTIPFEIIADEEPVMTLARASAAVAGAGRRDDAEQMQNEGLPFITGEPQPLLLWNVIRQYTHDPQDEPRYYDTDNPTGIYSLYPTLDDDGNVVPQHTYINADPNPIQQVFSNTPNVAPDYHED